MASKNNLQQEAMQNASTANYVSAQTQAAKANLDANYGSNPYGTFTPSQNTSDAYAQWQQTLANKPDAYKSNWNDTINNLLGQIVNREDFKYDFNADPLYQQYKDQYTTQGKNAMKDTVGQVASISGGYGNSYAETAGNQAYQGYLQQLNAIIPELYGKAMQKYQMDTDTLMGKYNAVGSQEDREYGQWSTNYGLWQGDRDYALNAYNTLWNQDFNVNQFNSNNWQNDRSFNYGVYRDLVSDDRNAYQNAYQAALNAQNYDYQLGRDQVSDNQWQTQFDYGKERDQVADNRWQTQFDYQKERDAVSDNQWALEYALKQANAKKGSGSKSSSAPAETKASAQALNDMMNYANSIKKDDGGNGSSSVAYLLQQYNKGNISQADFDAMIDRLGIDEDKLDWDAIRRLVG